MDSLKWWQKAVFYQIYPRSFFDGNGDGIGDLDGMISRLDYLKDLGIDAIWLSPHFPSPQVDVGYDISSYVDVAPEYGSLDQFKRFLDEAHRRDIRLVLDLVLNHTSDQHPWFIESRSSRDNPKRDWYVWKDGKNSGPPNGWLATFGGPAWEYDPATGQYYYHFFFKEQPDLNWRNPEVKEAMWDAVRFWLDMGVDGFRLDSVGTIYEDPALPEPQTDLTEGELYRMGRLAKTEEEHQEVHRQWMLRFGNQVEQPGVHELMRELRGVIDEYDDRVLIGETDDISYYGSGTDELHLVFNFPLMRTRQLTPDWVRQNQSLRLSALPKNSWPCNTLGNHDTPRVYSQFGDGIHNDAQARLHLALLLALKGTPFLYNGEEIGMSDYIIMDANLWGDPLALLARKHELEVMGASPEEAVLYGALRGRDKCRTPLQWANLENAGFSPRGVKTWLPINPDYLNGVNVEDEDKLPGSLLNFYRQMLAVRKSTPVLIDGDYQPFMQNEQNFLAFLRSNSSQTCLVLLNFSAQEQAVTLNLPQKAARLIFSSVPERPKLEPIEGMKLAPFEAYIAEI